MKISSVLSPVCKYLLYILLLLFCSSHIWAGEVQAILEIPLTVKSLDGTTLSETTPALVDTEQSSTLAQSAVPTVSTPRQGMADVLVMPAAVTTPAFVDTEQSSTLAQSAVPTVSTSRQGMADILAMPTAVTTPTLAGTEQSSTPTDPLPSEPETNVPPQDDNQRQAEAQQDAKKGSPNPEIDLELEAELLPQSEPEPEKFERIGVFVPEREEVLRASRAAKILHMDLQVGQDVQKDQVLVVFDCSVQRAEVEEARLMHDAAKVKHQVVVNARKKGEVAADEVELSRLEIEIVLAKLNRLRKALETCWIKAPFSGVIRKLLVNQQQTVPFLQPLIELSSTAPLRFELDIPVAWLEQISLGMEFEIMVSSLNKQYRAKISTLAKKVDISTQTVFGLAVLLSPDQHLREGMSGIAVFDFAQ